MTEKYFTHLLSFLLSLDNIIPQNIPMKSDYNKNNTESVTIAPSELVIEGSKIECELSTIIRKEKEENKEVIEEKPELKENVIENKDIDNGNNICGSSKEQQIEKPSLSVEREEL